MSKSVFLFSPVMHSAKQRLVVPIACPISFCRTCNIDHCVFTPVLCAASACANSPNQETFDLDLARIGSKQERTRKLFQIEMQVEGDYVTYLRSHCNHEK